MVNNCFKNIEEEIRKAEKDELLGELEGLEIELIVLAYKTARALENLRRINV